MNKLNELFDEAIDTGQKYKALVIDRVRRKLRKKEEAERIAAERALKKKENIYDVKAPSTGRRIMYIELLDLEDNVLHTFESLSDCAKFFDKKSNHISHTLSNHSKIRKDGKWYRIRKRDFI